MAAMANISSDSPLHLVPTTPSLRRPFYGSPAAEVPQIITLQSSPNILSSSSSNDTYTYTPPVTMHFISSGLPPIHVLFGERLASLQDYSVNSQSTNGMQACVEQIVPTTPITNYTDVDRPVSSLTVTPSKPATAKEPRKAPAATSMKAETPIVSQTLRRPHARQRIQRRRTHRFTTFYRTVQSDDNKQLNLFGGSDQDIFI